MTYHVKVSSTDHILDAGNIVAFLPKSFHGRVKINIIRKAKKECINILPVMAAYAVTPFNDTENANIHHDGTLQITNELPPSAGVTTLHEEGDEDDLCIINTDSGKVIIGILGEDVEPDRRGFLARLFQL